ncbi:NUDIX hydrolase [Candidatus Nomurabacteria bacterium]|nr:NUDIX hydrolase [Candidatus Nomurabacteria bacterium]
MSNINLKVGVLASHKGSLLLIKEINSKDKKYYWNIIKGTFDSEKDKDILATAHREAIEEAGVKISIEGFLNIITKSKKGGITIQINLIANLTSKKLKIASRGDQLKENEDIREVKFYTKKELRKMKKDDFMNERAFIAIRGWLNGKKNDISLLKFCS